jgi:hypothetical protein
MTVQEIVTRVRAAIDELMQNDSQFLGQSTDEANLTSVIVDKIGYALQHLLEIAPLDKLDSDVYEELTPQELQTNFSIDSELVGRVKLPKDLLRIIEARLSSWSHFPIPVSDTSQVYLMQQDKYARGSWDRPVNILTYIGADKTLEMYCAKAANDTLNFVFIRKPDMSNIDTDHMSAEVDVPAGLEASLIYQIAGLSMVAFREDVAASLFAIAARYLDPEQTKGGNE